MSFSSRDLRAAVLLASAALLAASPLHAATRTAPAKTAKAHVVSNSKATSSKASSTTVSHKSAALASRHSHKSGLKAVAAKPKSHGQQAIDSDRTAEIQEALIREHYLDGEPSGQWDQATREALTRFQGDHNWQTKIVPDSRALIKLGLGPSRQNLLNPESAAIAPAYLSVAERSIAGGSN
jgi:anti-sigma28 factor (negative regulator of flagellin synthesis)